VGWERRRVEEVPVASYRDERVAFASGGTTTPAYLAQPDNGADHPGVIVIQEWWGLVPHIEDICRRFAQEGYVALAPDLYHGQKADEPDDARKLAMALERDRAVDEIRAASEYLTGLEQVAPKRVGVVGWCMGGGLALSSAADGAQIGAAVAFYGRPLSHDDTAKLHVPVLGLYAEHDHGITASDVRQFELNLEQHRVPHLIHIYPGTSHAFFNDTRTEVYDPAAASDAWKRTLAWFGLHLSDVA
jgi:carboxymethylenebutenolidase